MYEKIKHELNKMNLFDVRKIQGYKIIKIKNLYHGPESNSDVMAKQVSNMINSYDNEFMIDVPIDPGMLVTKRIEDAEKNKNVSLGGMFLTLEQANRIVKIINENNAANI